MISSTSLRPKANLKFFFEGEEEAGSDRLGEYIAQNRDKLDPVDLWLFFDGPMHQSGRPLLTFGVRGGQRDLGLVATDRLGDLEALREEMDQSGVDVVDALAVPVECRVAHSHPV